MTYEVLSHGRVQWTHISKPTSADTLASYHINEVTRILTVISVITLPLTLISGIYGTNVPLPFKDHRGACFGIMGLTLAISISMLLYFRYRLWQ
jgi:magnesium transporter